MSVLLVCVSVDHNGAWCPEAPGLLEPEGAGSESLCSWQNLNSHPPEEKPVFLTNEPFL